MSSDALKRLAVAVITRAVQDLRLAEDSEVIPIIGFFLDTKNIWLGMMNFDREKFIARVLVSR